MRQLLSILCQSEKVVARRLPCRGDKCGQSCQLTRGRREETGNMSSFAHKIKASLMVELLLQLLEGFNVKGEAGMCVFTLVN